MSRLNCILLLSIFLITSNAGAENLFDKKSFMNLTADKKAHRIGDTVTILIVEKTVAESAANLDSRKEFGYSAGFENEAVDYSTSVGIRAKNRGDSVTRRNGFISGQITVTVQRINEIGHLVVSGQQHILINGEEQSIKVEGTLRPEDIKDNNTANSTRLTDARIEFNGRGSVSDSQRKSWVATVLSWLGLS